LNDACSRTAITRVVITSLTLAVIAVVPFLLTLGDGKDLAPPLADSDCAVRGPDPFLRVARDLPVTLHSTAPGRLMTIGLAVGWPSTRWLTGSQSA